LVGTERERTRGFAGGGFLADGGAAWEAVAGAAHMRRVQDALNRQVRYAGGSLHGEAYPRIYVVGTATSLGMRARHADVDGPTGKTAARSGRRVRELHVAGRCIPRSVAHRMGVAGPPRRPGTAVYGVYGAARRAGARRHVPTAWVIPGSDVYLRFSPDFATKVH
jgi:hypothetical protein